MALDSQILSRKTPTGPLVRHTKVPTLVFENSNDVSLHVAKVVAALIRERSADGKQAVLGLPTGSTPIGVYRELIRMHLEEGLDFSNVVTFNLDEYWPLDPNSIHSYNRWMRETFFDHVNVPEQNIHIPRGDLKRNEIDQFCQDYELQIEEAGGIDLQLLGIGRTGHIGFNEPDSPRNSLTRLVSLDPVTILDAASGFFGKENVPLRAITMGIGSILSARKIIVMALGEHKARVVYQSVEGDVTEQIPATFLQTHPNTIYAVDSAAARDLTATNLPWIVGPVDWTDQLEKRAVIWMAEEAQKPLLMLEASDFSEHHLHDLVKERGPVDKIRQRVFDSLLRGICTEPAGPENKTVICFSPHPDDDVISMGGTLIHIADAGHDIQIAYMTSGNIAVFDHDALRHINYVREFQKIFKDDHVCSESLYAKLCNDLSSKKPGDPDAQDILAIKALIRKTEATAGAEAAGVPAHKLHFLDLPFYRTGQVTKKPIGPDDVKIIADLLREQNPDQIYMAGDLSDPHGTHRVCAEAIIQALEVVAAEGIVPEVWLYRGAWQDYEPYEIEMAVPLSPEVALRKKMAIFKHESQKDRALFPGSDEREFWLRAEQRTKDTARRYNHLGLPEYFALEGFVRYTKQL
ncbi:MAG TPA: glucosamine-6-phosphate deaminase [Planctomycetaceae bacterium]|nr:glucosamine-6-phosphate deaminase [Planctomycetaceae bacterium]